MPAKFDACVSKGGRVRRKKLKHGKYVNICFDDSGSHAGYVKTAKTKSKSKSKKR